MELILNKAKAEAIYSAMCALNNVNGRIKVEFGDIGTEGINIFELESGSIRVAYVKKYSTRRCETYTTQDDFKQAYEL